MSDEIERARYGVRRMVMEAAELAEQPIDAPEFYRDFLKRVVACLAAKGAAVWTPDEARTLKLDHHLRFGKRGLADIQLDMQHATLLQRTFADDIGRVVGPPPDEGRGFEGCNPTEHLLILAPIRVGEEPRSLVEVFQRPGAPLATRRGYLRFLRQMCDLAGKYHKNRG